MRINTRMTALIMTLIMITQLMHFATLPVFAADILEVQANGFIAAINSPAPSAITIYTAQDLYDIRNDLSGSYVLMNDIDLSTFNGGQWVPIGSGSGANSFTGTFDGQGYVIYNLTITLECQYAGLFGYISGATIKNIRLEGTYIDITYDSYNAYVGGICGYANNTSINNCYNIGDISAASTASASNSPASGGGICATAAYVTISNCYNRGTISVNSSSDASTRAGGICGTVASDVSINNCYNTGNISADSSSSSMSATSAFAGGICGYSTPFVNNIYINNCYSTGDVYAASSFDGTARTGGFSGYAHTNIYINNCYWNIESTQKVNNNDQIPKMSVGVGTYNGITTSLTSAEMKIQASFAGFNFNTIWGFIEGVNNDYPILQAFYRSVFPIIVSGVTLNKSAVTLTEGNTETLMATVTPDDATNKAVTWSSSNEDVATVDGNGTVSAIAEGAATITVTTSDGGKTVNCEVTVIAPVKTIIVGTQNGTLTEGTEGDITFIITTENIADGTAITLNNTNSVVGITLETKVTTNNSTNITIATTAGTPQGSHPLTLTIDGVTSDTFYLLVDAPIPTTHAVTFSVTGGNGSLAVTADGGSITSGADVEDGKDVVFTANPNGGYCVKLWTDNGSAVNGTNTTYTIANIAEEHIITVEFEPVPPTTYTVAFKRYRWQRLAHGNGGWDRHYIRRFGAAGQGY